MDIRTKWLRPNEVVHPGMSPLVDDTGCQWDDSLEWFYDLIGLCGCANHEILERINVLIRRLAVCYTTTNWCWWDTGEVPDDALTELLLLILDNLGLVDHGSSIHGAFLTSDGNRIVTMALSLAKDT